MRPRNLETKIFLDGGDPAETRETIRLLGFLDGQTTNPTLIAKNPAAQKRLSRGEKFSSEEILTFYKNIVQEISSLIPEGSVSVEVYADRATAAEAMMPQAREMYTWIPNAHIKLPTTHKGLQAAEKAIQEKMRVNMTLCFSQEQAAAVHAATRGVARGDVFVSPFVGRLDDRGENGMDLIGDILRMYREEKSPVEVLTASVRNLDHFLYAIALGSDIITAPFKILKEWAEKGLPMPDVDFAYTPKNFWSIPYQKIDCGKEWSLYNISHDLTDQGIDRFSQDWNNLLA